MKFKEINGDNLLLSENGNDISINLGKIKSINTSANFNLQTNEIIRWLLVALFAICTIANFYYNYSDRIVSKEDEKWITQGVYLSSTGASIQIGGTGNDIDDVDLGADGKWHYKRSSFAFMIWMIVCCIPLTFVASYTRLINSNKPRMKNDTHSITLAIDSIPTPKIIESGGIGETLRKYNLIKMEIERVKIK